MESPRRTLDSDQSSGSNLDHIEKATYTRGSSQEQIDTAVFPAFGRAGWVGDGGEGARAALDLRPFACAFYLSAVGRPVAL